MGEPRGCHGCTLGGMFGEGSLGPGGPGMWHRAHWPLLGSGNVPGTGLAGCPGSQTGVSASSGTGHGHWCGLLPPGQGRDEEGKNYSCELPPPLLWPQHLQTAVLTQHCCTGHSQCRMDPGESTRMGPGESIPDMPGWISMVSSMLGQQQHRDKTGTILRDPCCPVSVAQGRILAGPLSHPASWMHG